MSKAAAAKFQTNLAAGLILLFALACSAILPEPAYGFEVKQGHAPSVPKLNPKINVEQLSEPVIKLDDTKRELLDQELCGQTFLADEEAALQKAFVLFPVPEPLVKEGQSFTWQIGQHLATTYFDRKPLGEGRFEVSLYVPKHDLFMKFPASAMVVQSTNGMMACEGTWCRGSKIYFLDTKTGEALHISYYSSYFGNDAWLHRIDRGTIDCSRSMAPIVEFEVTRGPDYLLALNSKGESLPKINLAAPGSKEFGVDQCESLVSPTFEWQPHLYDTFTRLPEAFKKDGQTFEWSIGSEKGLTYWDRKSLGKRRYQVSLYFAAIDLKLKFTATSMFVGNLQNPEYDTYITFWDRTTKEALSVHYAPRIDSVELSGLKHFTADVEVLEITRGTLVVDPLKQERCGYESWPKEDE
jgi:hypothetical protein